MSKDVSGTAQYGQQGSQMLVNLRRAAWLPKYDADGKLKVVQEINDLYERIHETLEAAHGMDTDDPRTFGISCSVIVHHNALERNKRILCAYHKYRMDVLEDQRWEKGPVLSEFARNKVNSNEEKYFTDYSKLLNDYIKAVDINITANLAPPKELKQEIEVMENVGDLQTDSGSVSLLRNTRHFGNINDYESLLRNGKVIKTKR